MLFYFFCEKKTDYVVCLVSSKNSHKISQKRELRKLQCSSFYLQFISLFSRLNQHNLEVTTKKTDWYLHMYQSSLVQTQPINTNLAPVRVGHEKNSKHKPNQDHSNIRIDWVLMQFPFLQHAVSMFSQRNLGFCTEFGAEHIWRSSNDCKPTRVYLNLRTLVNSLMAKSCQHGRCTKHVQYATSLLELHYFSS